MTDSKDYLVQVKCENNGTGTIIRLMSDIGSLTINPSKLYKAISASTPAIRSGSLYELIKAIDDTEREETGFTPSGNGYVSVQYSSASGMGIDIKAINGHIAIVDGPDGCKVKVVTMGSRAIHGNNTTTVESITTIPALIERVLGL